MSGRGFGGGRGGRAADNSAHYTTLGVSKDASETDIKKAYRKLAMTHHPDKGGDAAAFSKIQEAYEVIGNPEKRQLYDAGGSDAVERGSADTGDDMGSIFDIFNGSGGGRRQQQRGPRTTESVRFPVSLTLEEMYNGLNKHLRITRSVCCKSCDGKGGQGSTSCGTCNGRGTRVVMQRIGPGMISQSQMTCDVCQGEGTIIPPGGRCVPCSGQKVVKEKLTLDVVVPKGAMNGATVVFSGVGDQYPGHLPGDVIVVFEPKPHATFKRRGAHLFTTIKISLLDALSGFTTYITHLDGRQVQVRCDHVITPGSTICLEEEGMPVSFGSGRGIDIGNMYVTFDVVFPTKQQMGQNPRQFLSKALPSQALHTDKPIPQRPTSQPVPQPVSLDQLEARFKREESEWNKYQSHQEQAASQHDEDEGVHMHGQPACQPM